MYDVIILGSGPAGYTAGLYTSRAFLKTLILAGPELGGQLTTTTLVENYPGFTQGIQGSQLMDEMKKQVERFGAEVKLESAVKIDLKQSPFQIWTENKTYQGKTLIIATGASAKYLGLASEQKLRGKGVSACATCDGFFFQKKEVVVVGGGDTAMEEAIFLTRFATKVTIIHRREEFRASPIMLDRAKNNSKINFLTNKTIIEVLGKERVEGIKIKDIKTGKVEEISTQGFFLAIGHQPNTDIFKGVIDMDKKGYIYVKGIKNPLDAHTQTNIPGVFAVGDCVDFRYRQAVVAAGMGCMAAIDAQKWLEEQH